MRAIHDTTESAEQAGDPREIGKRAIARARAGQGPLNAPAWCEWYGNFYAPAGGATIGLDEDQVAAYNANPDRFVAEYMGFSTVAEYYEWVETDGTPLCSERTKSGTLCRNPNGTGRSQLGAGGDQTGAARWRERHRTYPCSIHGGRS
jgi:hypothetical protein